MESVPIDSIKPDPANVRKHPESNLAAIASSLKRFGQQKPLVVDGEGIIRAGNGTHAAAKSIGWREIGIIRTQLKGADAIAFAIADNRTAEMAEWDIPGLGASWESLDEALKVASGFDEKAMADLLKSIAPPVDSSGENREISGSLQLIVECPSEEYQKSLYEELTAKGLKCRVLTL